MSVEFEEEEQDSEGPLKQSQSKLLGRNITTSQQVGPGHPAADSNAQTQKRQSSLEMQKEIKNLEIYINVLRERLKKCLENNSSLEEQPNFKIQSARLLNLDFSVERGTREQMLPIGTDKRCRLADVDRGRPGNGQPEGRTAGARV